MGKTSIEWTDRSANPIQARNKNTGRWGWHCVLKSPGCANCYSQTFNMRFGTKLPYQARSADQIEIRFDPRPMEAILRLRKKHQRIFLCDMTDLFGEFVPDEMIDQMFAYMASAGNQIFQVLTKRPDRAAAWFKRVSERGIEARDRYVRELREYHLGNIYGYQEGFTLPSPPTPELRFIYDSACIREKDRYQFDRNPKPMGHGFSGGEYHWRKWPLDNVWLGVSVEDQQRADERIPILLQIPAAVRFLSVEPLLGPVALTAWMPSEDGFVSSPEGPIHIDDGAPLIHWVIVGGESGPNARPCNLVWISDLIRQCRESGVHCFVKQLGSRPFVDSSGGHRYDDHTYYKVRDKKGGDLDEFPHDLRVRESPR